MPRVMEIVTPLERGPAVPRHARARGIGPAGRVPARPAQPRRTDINLDDILGKNVTVKLALPDDSTRYFNGFVTRFSAGGRLRPLFPLFRRGPLRGSGF